MGRGIATVALIRVKVEMRRGRGFVYVIYDRNGIYVERSEAYYRTSLDCLSVAYERFGVLYPGESLELGQISNPRNMR